MQAFVTGVKYPVMRQPLRPRAADHEDQGNGDG